MSEGKRQQHGRERRKEHLRDMAVIAGNKSLALVIHAVPDGFIHHIRADSHYGRRRQKPHDSRRNHGIHPPVADQHIKGFVGFGQLSPALHHHLNKHDQIKTEHDLNGIPRSRLFGQQFDRSQRGDPEKEDGCEDAGDHRKIQRFPQPDDDDNDDKNQGKAK